MSSVHPPVHNPYLYIKEPDYGTKVTQSESTKVAVLSDKAEYLTDQYTTYDINGVIKTVKRVATMVDFLV